ncbi:MAG: ribonuclease III, partial [Candidatus Eremiobacteraeota bacterium]|nr:ribonuclease III [Candidatus Eremiobacteraeota bacterium]
MAGESRRARIRALLRRAGTSGIEPAAVAGAFVHSSAARQSVTDAGSSAAALESNERLEFLGDTVIGFVVARWLYERYPAADEG